MYSDLCASFGCSINICTKKYFCFRLELLKTALLVHILPMKSRKVWLMMHLTVLPCLVQDVTDEEQKSWLMMHLTVLDCSMALFMMSLTKSRKVWLMVHLTVLDCSLLFVHDVTDEEQKSLAHGALDSLGLLTAFCSGCHR